MMMTNFNHRFAILPLMAGMAVSAYSVASGTTYPEDYGMLHGRSVSSAGISKVKGFATGKNAKSPLKVQAYANDGNAEVEKLGELFLVEQEDFSLLTTGSEENPDFNTDLEISMWMLDEDGNIIWDEKGEPIPNPEYEYPWNNMKPEFISGDGGWGVGNAFPAGGMLYFPFSQNSPQGKISTPWIDLSAYAGTFVLEFKVKITDAALNNPTAPSMIIVETAETNNMSPTWDLFEESFFNYDLLSTEWTTFRLIFQGAGKSTLCNIVGQGLDGGMYIDDIKIYSMKPYLATPVLMRHTDFTEESFVANWKPVEGADKYLVDVWYDDLYGERHMLADKAETTETSYKVEGTNLDDTYFYKVQAINSKYNSLEPLPKEVFDIVTPVMRKANVIDNDKKIYEGGVEEVISAFGYNYFATAQREASQDGPFVVTNETFTGWSHPLYEDGWNYTKENPVDDMIVSLYFPTDLKQQGWYGENFQIYKDYICLVPFFYEASNHQEQTAWVSPEFDLSKDGGKVTVSMKLAAQYDINFENYASCIVGLFNWNEEKGDYDQAEIVYCTDLNFDWQERTVTFDNATSRSKIAFFGVGSFGDLYIDDIVITQNYKAGDKFYDPFYFSTWQLAEQMMDPTTFEFEVPAHAFDHDIYQKAQAVRMHFDSQGNYDGEASSQFTANDLVTQAPTGMSMVENDLLGCVKVSDGVIFINNSNEECVTISTADGKHLTLGNNTSLNYRPESHGIYIVTVGNHSIKLAL